MARKNYVLVDQSASGSVSSELPEGVDFLTLQDGLSAGVRLLKVRNDKFEVHLLPTRGMSIWKCIANTSDGYEEIGWKSPVAGPVHPNFVPLGEPSGLGWLDGFDELLVRCGLESNGAPEFDEQGQLKYPLHGRIGNKPAHRLELNVDEDTGDIEVVGWVRETRFHFLKAELKSAVTLRQGTMGLEIRDELTNLSAGPAEMQLLYHVNFGRPLLDAGAQVVAPIAELVPRNPHAAGSIDSWQHYQADTPGFEEQVYFAKLQADPQGNTLSMLRNAHGTRGALLRYNVSELPCMTYWKNTTAIEDGYVTGIEPGTNFPNPRSFEGQQGRVIRLEGKSSTSIGLDLLYCDSDNAVKAAETKIQRLAGQESIIHQKPQPNWCAS